jgi:hypothetical protein
MISPSAPYLQLLASESASDDPTTVRFVAHFGLEWPLQRLEEAKYIKVYSPYSPGVKLAPPSGPYQLVRVKFTSTIASRMLPGFSDREVVNPEIYDASGLPYRFKPGQGVEEWKRQFQSAWAQNRLCPNPRMYEVSNSSWIDELKLSNEFKHFLLMGHDTYVEIIAKHWDWVSEGGIPQ